MKCWKCGQEIVDGASVCTYCGASRARTAPTTEVGYAMRTLYDRYGAQEVLTNSAYLVNGLGDLVDDTRKLRNQLRMAMDAGIGRPYLEQLSAGVPDSGFDSRVKILLTEEAGLSDKAAGELLGYFDEMIGWRTVSQPRSAVQPQAAEKIIRSSDEIDRTGRYTAPDPEIEQRQTQKKAEPVQPKVVKKEMTGWNDLYRYEKVMVVCLVLEVILEIAYRNYWKFTRYDSGLYMCLDYTLHLIILIPLILSFAVKKVDMRRKCFATGTVLTVAAIVMLLLPIMEGVYLYRTFYAFRTLSQLIELFRRRGLLVISAIVRYTASRNWKILFMQATGLLLFLQVIRHRILERKHAKT